MNRILKLIGYTLWYMMWIILIALVIIGACMALVMLVGNYGLHIAMFMILYGVITLAYQLAKESVE